jgi:hypothetical protein
MARSRASRPPTWDERARVGGPQSRREKHRRGGVARCDGTHTSHSAVNRVTYASAWDSTSPLGGGPTSAAYTTPTAQHLGCPTMSRRRQQRTPPMHASGPKDTKTCTKRPTCAGDCAQGHQQLCGRRQLQRDGVPLEDQVRNNGLQPLRGRRADPGQVLGPGAVTNPCRAQSTGAGGGHRARNGPNKHAYGERGVRGTNTHQAPSRGR